MLQNVLNKFNTVKTVKDLVISLLIFIIAPAIVGFVASILDGIPIVGLIVSIISWLFGILCFIGIVLSILGFVKNNLK
ncbi:MAG: hypothetical protein IJW37_09755 [Lachnospiraceae bacterium]|nr:hypothetical protein [Lachnospiraceae bacterium]